MPSTAPFLTLSSPSQACPGVLCPQLPASWPSLHGTLLPFSQWEKRPCALASLFLLVCCILPDTWLAAGAQSQACQATAVIVICSGEQGSDRCGGNPLPLLCSRCLTTLTVSLPGFLSLSPPLGHGCLQRGAYPSSAPRGPPWERPLRAAGPPGFSVAAVSQVV